MLGRACRSAGNYGRVIREKRGVGNCRYNKSLATTLRLVARGRPRIHGVLRASQEEASKAAGPKRAVIGGPRTWNADDGFGRPC